jgi:hypothetical protein
VRPLSPGGDDLVTGVGGSAQGRRPATVATDLRVGGRQCRVVVGPLPLDNVGSVAGREALVSESLQSIR